MKAVLWHNGNRREIGLADAVAAGAKRCGDTIEVRQSGYGVDVVDCDLVCLIGAKTRKWFRAYRDAGIPAALFDKGYVRNRYMTPLRFWRVSVNGMQPLRYLQVASHTTERWDGWGVKVGRWRERSGDAVLIAASSPKAMLWSGVEDVTGWVNDLIRHLRTLTDRPIIYRPRATWREAEAVEGAKFWPERYELPDCMAESHVMVVYNSNACFDGVLYGLPSIVLGEAVGRPICSTSIEDVERPRMADRSEIRRWLANLAWCQFTLKEYASGRGWQQIRTMVEAAA